MVDMVDMVDVFQLYNSFTQKRGGKITPPFFAGIPNRFKWWINPPYPPCPPKAASPPTAVSNHLPRPA